LIANAIADAVGARVHELPITFDNVLKAISAGPSKPAQLNGESRQANVA
jgi:hypothetical protein